MKFIIDHTTQLIHKTPYVGDSCNLTETPLEEREGTHDTKYVENLRGKKGYTECENCSNEDIFWMYSNSPQG